MTNNAQNRPLWVWLVAAVAVIFGLLTIKSGGAVVLADGEARKAAGNYVGFVVWFNFLAGFAYVAAGVGLWLMQRWAAWLAGAIVVGTLIVFAAFGLHVANGGLFETRTAIAMTVRSTVWLVIAAIALRQLRLPAR